MVIKPKDESLLIFQQETIFTVNLGGGQILYWYISYKCSISISQQETIFTVNLGEPDELKKKEVINAGRAAGAYCCIWENLIRQ